eukprot:CAMPEP_0179136894 /NCGR_PEP_ID=MMETSP0796-20121207/65264_1 /TAXON_ID=73915 /ORGANISM="Pyrodinium bahamense, Strain pbaha01" /LENGTH=70 /DNA_ID=CAMNT_0020836017 /DNA_START=370 /DNA_END=578 /DNA_ORIENTATION=-
MESRRDVSLWQLVRALKPPSLLAIAIWQCGGLRVQQQRQQQGLRLQIAQGADSRTSQSPRARQTTWLAGS